MAPNNIGNAIFFSQPKYSDRNYMISQTIISHIRDEL